MSGGVRAKVSKFISIWDPGHPARQHGGISREWDSVEENESCTQRARRGQSRPVYRPGMATGGPVWESALSGGNSISKVKGRDMCVWSLEWEMKLEVKVMWESVTDKLQPGPYIYALFYVFAVYICIFLNHLKVCLRHCNPLSLNTLVCISSKQRCFLIQQVSSFLCALFLSSIKWR